MMFALPYYVGVNVEVCEEDQHEQHVAGQKVLAPGWKITSHVDRVQRMRKRYAKLDLKRIDMYNR